MVTTASANNSTPHILHGNGASIDLEPALASSTIDDMAVRMGLPYDPENRQIYADAPPLPEEGYGLGYVKTLTGKCPFPSPCLQLYALY